VNYLHWLLRAKRWATHPPPMSRVILVVAIIAFCVALVAVERTVGLPDWMSAERARPPVIR